MGTASEKISHELLIGRKQTAALLRSVVLATTLAFVVISVTGTVQRATEQERLAKERQLVIYLDSVSELGILAQRIPLLALSRLMVEKDGFREKAKQGLISVTEQFRDKVSHLLEGNLVDTIHLSYSAYFVPILEEEPYSLKATLGRFLQLSKSVSEFDKINAVNASQMAELNSVSMKLVSGLRALGSVLKLESENGILALSRRATLLLYFNGLISALLGVVSVLYIRRRTSRILKNRAEAEMRISNVATSLEHFADVVAHDLSSPINNIANASKMLSGLDQIKTQSPRVSPLIEILESESARLGAMLKSLLRFSKTDQASISCEEFDLGKEIDQLRGLFNAELKKRGGEIKFEGCCTLYGDKALLGVVLQNLIQNSIKYCHPNDALNIHITCSVPNEKNVQELSVRDTGKGIPEGMHEKIFDIFVRGPGEPQKTGRGLGLATCKKIIEQHGGRIYSEPVVNGAKIVIELPAKLI